MNNERVADDRRRTEADEVTSDDVGSDTGDDRDDANDDHMATMWGCL